MGIDRKKMDRSIGNKISSTLLTIITKSFGWLASACGSAKGFDSCKRSLWNVAENAIFFRVTL